MTSPRRTPILLTCAALTLTPTIASASYPAGVWALVEKVTLDPDAKNPTQIRIDGLFMVANTKPDFDKYPGYSIPQYGYMYYECGAKDLATCQAEWTELAAVAMSDDRCRGWGDSSLLGNGVVRTEEPMAKPDVWPISMGILIGFSPCDALKAWMAENPPGAGTDSDTSGGDSSGGFNTGSSGDEQDTSSSSSGGASSTSAGDPATTGPSPTSGASAASAGESGDDSSSGGSSGGAADTGQNPTDGDKGCACDTRDNSRPTAALALLLALLVRPRRRARA